MTDPSPTAHAVDEPVRRLLERIAAPAAAATPDLPAIGDALARFAGDRDYLARWVDRLGEEGGALAIHAPPTGPRLLIVHRPAGGMSAVHDHATWVALATVAGLETHRRYRVIADGPGRRIERFDERGLGPREVVTLLPPDDIHDHGHLVEVGAPAHVLVLTGDDQTRFERNEWDLATGRHRVLRRGIQGRWLADQPMP